MAHEDSPLDPALRPLLQPGAPVGWTQDGPAMARTASGFFVPAAPASPATEADHFSTYLTLEEYIAAPLNQVGGRFSAERWVVRATEQQEPESLLAALAALNHAIHNKKLLAVIQEDFTKRLRSDARALLEEAMSEAPARAFLARQCVLRAMREVLIAPPRRRAATTTFTPPDAAVLLTHAVANRTLRSSSADNEIVCGLPARIFMETVQNYHFNQHQDPGAILARTWRLWTDYGSKIKRAQLLEHPTQLLRRALGVDLEDVLALGLAWWGALQRLPPGQPPVLTPTSGYTKEPTIVARVLSYVLTTREALSAQLLGSDPEWGFLPFEEHPLLRLDDEHCLVLDERLLLNRITTGLFWAVHDWLKHGGPGSAGGERSAQEWRQAYGEMVELMVEAQLQRFAPPLLNGDTTFWGGEEVKRRLPGRKTCDAAIHFGDVLLLAETVNAQMSGPSRHAGELEQFKQDTQRLVIKKVHQLDSTAAAVIADETKLTGWTQAVASRVLPVCIQGREYPLNPLTLEYIVGEIRAAGLLDSARLAPLCVIDLGELDALEGLHESKGVSLHHELLEWQRAPGAHAWSLRNFLLSRYDHTPATTRTVGHRQEIDALFGRLEARIRHLSTAAPHSP